MKVEMNCRDISECGPDDKRTVYVDFVVKDGTGNRFMKLHLPKAECIFEKDKNYSVEIRPT